MNHAPLSNLPHQVVRASAGAGKTYQLTTRYLDLLVRQESPQQILATTFTRKAAGEVLARVLGRLASACGDKDQQKQLADALNLPDLSHGDCIAMLRSLTERLNRLTVGTIDGFFNRAARAMAMELGLPPDPRLIDEGSPLAQQMRFDAIQAVLGEQAGNEEGLATLIEMLRRLHHDTAQRSVTEAIDSIVKDLGDVYRMYSDRSLWGSFPDTGRLDKELLDTAIEAFAQKAADLPKTKAGGFNQAFKRAYDAIRNDAQSDDWDNLLTNSLIQKIVTGKQTFSRAVITEDWIAAIKPLLIHAQALRLSALADQTLATYDLLAMFNRHYENTRYAQRVLLFSDLTHVLAEGLPGLGGTGVDELCYRLDAKVTHLLLDEFQDTSLRQWDVLEPFAQQITDNFEDSRSLFCVGDTKQAIYGWRGGCAELFDAVEALPGVDPTSLSDSYRSSQVVLDSVNQVFTSLVGNPALTDCQPAAQQWQSNFELHRAVKADLPGHVVLQTTAPQDTGPSSDSADEDDFAPPDAHAQYVATYIQKLVEQIPGRSIGVLMRSRAKARTLMHALRSLGVNAAEEGGNPIGHDPAVSAVLAAIQFADYPGDKVARFHATNSPVGELLGLVGHSHPEAIARDLRRVLIDRGYAAVIAEWAEALAESCEPISLRRLVQLIELAESYDADGATLRPSFFVQSVQAAKVEDASPAPVRVMTIHASKGLEFDAVVLPDLDGTLSAQDSRDLIVLDRDSPIDRVRGVYRRLPKELMTLTPALEQAHAQRAYEKRTEDLCLLYVAMTRAMQGLHLLVRPLKADKKGNPTATGRTNLSYAAVLRQALSTANDEGVVGDECLYEAGQTSWGGEAVEPAEPTIPPTYSAEPIQLVQRPDAQMRSWVKASPSQMHDQARVHARDLLRFDTSGGQRYGTAIHTMLEQVGFIEDGMPTRETLSHSVAHIDTTGIDVEQAITSLLQKLSTPTAQQLLQRNGAETLWRERRFSVKLGDRLVPGCFDRVHLWHDENDKPIRAVLIDYKTDRVDDQTIDGVVEHYVDQLRQYRRALAVMLNLDKKAIQTMLYFVGDDRFASVE